MNKGNGIDKNKILAVARSDIKWADDHYRDHVEEDLIRRYEVYRSNLERYRRMWPKLSEQNEFRTFDLWSLVEWMLPDMLKAFFGADRIISISGVGPEDADRAERVMKLIQWQLTVKNQGYRIFKSWFADALATNLGVLKCYWKKETKTTQHQEVLDQNQLTGILQNPDNRVTASEPIPDIMSVIGMAPPKSMVSWEETKVTVNQPVIEVVRPTDIRFTPDGRSLSECSMVAHRKAATLDQLRKDARRGLYDRQAVEDAARAQSGDYELTELEKMLDDGAEDALNREPGPEKARTRVVVYECYLKSDLNGDGLLEDAIVTVCNDVLLRATENPYGRVPFFDLVPFWDSYQVWSKIGLAEIVQETQDAHAALLRQMVVALGLSNQPMGIVDTSRIELQDLLDGMQFVRSKGAIDGTAFQPLQLAGLRPENFQFFEYLRAQLEQWTPVTRYNQGTDASSLNKTATGINAIMTASQKREEEIIRNFAETGIRELFRFLVQLNQRYLDQPQIVRLQGDILEFAPDDLNGDFDLSVDAASGIGARDAKVQVLTAYLREMLPAAAQFGIAGPQQFVMAGQKLLKLMGIEDAEKYLMLPAPQPMMTGGGMALGPGTGQAGGAVAPELGGGQGAGGPGGV
jgi:hypothetical protein